jgi:hypothetical protein
VTFYDSNGLVVDDKGIHCGETIPWPQVSSYGSQGNQDRRKPVHILVNERIILTVPDENAAEPIVAAIDRGHEHTKHLPHA